MFNFQAGLSVEQERYLYSVLLVARGLRRCFGQRVEKPFDSMNDDLALPVVSVIGESWLAS